jgi:hypothetical protein
VARGNSSDALDIILRGIGKIKFGGFVLLLKEKH